MVGSGSPHTSQGGGVSGRIERQHRSQTEPQIGWSSCSAQAGASHTDKSASAASRRSPVVRTPMFLEIDALGVAPQSLETVVQARLGREDVHDEVEVIEQDPFRLLVAFDVRRLGTRGGEGFHDPVGDGPNLSRAGTRTNHEIVGEPERLPQIENDQIGRLLVLDSADCHGHLQGRPRGFPRFSAFAMQPGCCAIRPVVGASSTGNARRVKSMLLNVLLHADIHEARDRFARGASVSDGSG